MLGPLGPDPVPLGSTALGPDPEPLGSDRFACLMARGADDPPSRPPRRPSRFVATGRTDGAAAPARRRAAPAQARG